MSAGSAVQILQQTPSRLVISTPPYYLMGSIFLFTGIAACGFVFLARRGHGHLVFPSFLPFVLAAPFLLAGLGMMWTQSRAVFSREDGTLSMGGRFFGFPRHESRIPLGTIEHAEVSIGGRGTHSLVVVLVSGDRVRLTNYSTQTGQAAAAKAINEFLGKE